MKARRPVLLALSSTALGATPPSPTYVTADSVLHAFHHSYDALLEEREDDRAWWRRFHRAAPPSWTWGWRSEARSKRPSMESDD